MKKIALLTSSRADYSIYLPLLKELKSEGKIAFDIIAFGSHGSPYHGETVKVIEKDGFKVKSCVES
jgi:GDP/UDP-N,N'-diacetylbacillosamine 2-epimerase (hydrolysing)